MRLFQRASIVAVLGSGTAFAQEPAPEQPTPDQPAPEQPSPAPDQPGDAEEIVVIGRVIDVLGKPVRGATIRLEGQAEDAAPLGKTDRKGQFQVKAPIGATLVVESKAFGVGIATVTGRTVDDVVLLTEKQLGETITVESEAPAAAPGAAQLDREELQRVPGTGGDVVRALTVMPGVVNLQVPLGYSGVVIRGSSPQDSRVFIDDFDVPVLYHNIGFRAVVPAETIETLDFVPGGFDVAYGRATSGIVLLKTRAGSRDKRSTQAELSVIDGGLLAQGPIGKKSSYMFALRRSTIDFVLPSVIPDDVDLSLTTVPRYWDGQLRLDTDLSERWRGTLSLVGTDDTFELVGSKNEDAETKRFYNRTRFLRTTAALRFKEGPWTANIALSALLPQFIFELGKYQYIRTTQPTVTPRFEVARNEAEAIGLKNVEWRFGAEAPIARSNAQLALPRETREGEANPVFDPMDTSTLIDESVWLPDVAAWTAIAADFDPRVRVNLGVRAEAFGRPGEYGLSPRGEMQIKMTADGEWKLRLSAGAFRRPPEFQSELLSETAKSEKSKQMIAGVQWEPEQGIRVQASTYYNDRTALLRSDEMGNLTNTGRGKTYGGEVLGTYRKGDWFGWLSYAYSKSTRIDAPGANERLFDFDQPHSMNAAGSYKIGNWILGGRFQLYSGLPFTPITQGIFDSDRNIYLPVNAPINSDRAPIHHQLDVRVDYNWKWGPVDLTAFLDVQNVYMNESVVTYFYSYDFSERVAFKSIPIIPSIGLRGVF